jgi:hypothetical protein
MLRWRFTGFNPHGDIEAVFEADPPPGVADEADEIDGLSELGFTDDGISRSSREIRRPVVFRLSNSKSRDETLEMLGRGGSPGAEGMGGSQAQ